MTLPDALDPSLPSHAAPAVNRVPLSARIRVLDDIAARGPLWARLVELFRFGFVGAVAFVVDIGLFNLLRFGPGELLGAKPLTAKVVSASVATVVAWIGNRYWTFSDSKTSSRSREFFGYALVNVVGMMVAVVCLWFSHYVLGLRSPLADNISSNFVGVALGTIVRYVGYKLVVFTGEPEAATDEAAPATPDRAAA